MEITIDELRNDLDKYITISINEDVFITNNGKQISKLSNSFKDNLEKVQKLFVLLLGISL